MQERFRVLQENGYEYVGRTVQLLEDQGYTILRVPKESELGLVPFCVGTGGEVIKVPGWSILAETPKPKRKQSMNRPAEWPWREEPDPEKFDPHYLYG